MRGSSLRTGISYAALALRRFRVPPSWFRAPRELVITPFSESVSVCSDLGSLALGALRMARVRQASVVGALILLKLMPMRSLVHHGATTALLQRAKGACYGQCRQQQHRQRQRVRGLMPLSSASASTIPDREVGVFSTLRLVLRYMLLL
ncbi:unnamed protein product [Ectocarpus sp. 12 AP-2014]